MARYTSRGRDVVIVVDVAVRAGPRRNGMCICQRESGARMIELSVQPSICAVALFAISWETSGYVAWVSCSLVVRCMTGIALRSEALKLPGGSALVARLAIYRRMRADKREAILMVTDRRHGNLPALHRVTRFAIRSELAAVKVCMAVRAFLSDVRKDQFHVALAALHFLVHTAQRVARLVVVKLRNTADRLPTQRGVAVLAGNIESPVRIACTWFLRRTLRPLSVDLERKKKNTDLNKFSTEHGTTSLGSPMPSSRD